MKKVLIAMSGGVDSSVAASLMQQQGWDCIGATMTLYRNEDIGRSSSRTCCSLDDVEDARSVAFRLRIPYYVFNFSDEFRCQVMDRFADAYGQGQTPNPCIDCNRYLKFRHLYDRAALMGCDAIATGHYVRIERGENGRYLLKKALDSSKDQSYVLYMLTQEQLAHTQFPLGALRKAETRQLADSLGFFNARKPDSQDICFVPDGDYAAFIRRHTGKADAPGDFVDESGRILGRHKGIAHYTIGQRKGLGIPSNRPLYVKAIDPKSNQVVLSENDALFSQQLTGENFNWIAWEAPPRQFRCSARIRYRQTEQPCEVTVEENGSVQVLFDRPQRPSLRDRRWYSMTETPFWAAVRFYSPWPQHKKPAERSNLSAGFSSFYQVSAVSSAEAIRFQAWSQMALKVWSLMSCSILQASSSAVSGSTPKLTRKRVKV